MRIVRIIIGIVVLVAVVHFVPFLRPLERWIVGAGGGFVGSMRSAGIGAGDFFSSLGQADRLASENEQLRVQVSDLEKKISDLAGIAAENEQLKGMLGLRERSDITLVPANVIGSDPDATLHAVVIDCGSSDGVSKGDAVIAGNGIFIGKIIKADPSRSTVLLSFDPRSRVAGMVEGRPEANGVAEGRRGLVINLSLVPQNAAINGKDSVVTTGLEPGIPRGLLIGSVDAVNRTPSEPFISATVIPSFDPLQLTAVSVIHKK